MKLNITHFGKDQANHTALSNEGVGEIELSSAELETIFGGGSCPNSEGFPYGYGGGDPYSNCGGNGDAYQNYGSSCGDDSYQGYGYNYSGYGFGGHRHHRHHRRSEDYGNGNCSGQNSFHGQY